ncbi:MAG: type IV pilus modification PilV family protein [Minisyncoccota bacterium]
MTTRISQQSGFTLLETMVAIAILLVAVIGSISLIGDSLHKLYYAKDGIIATNLAQEGIEVVRQTRDSNFLSGAAWDSGFTMPAYIVDVGGGQPLIPCSGCDQIVYLDAATGFYRQGAGFTADTQFSRIITVRGTGDERQIVSTVTWKTGGDTGTIAITENLFKWALP